MEKKYVAKLEEIVEKLKTADTREAFRILHRLQYGPFLENAGRSLVKQDFSLNKNKAIILLTHAITQQKHGFTVDLVRGFSIAWFNSKKRKTKIIFLAIDCSNMKKVEMKIAHTGKHNGSLNFDDKVTPPPAELKAIVDGLEGFTEQKPGLWIRPLGGIRNLAQAKRLIKPIWDVVYNAIAPFGEAW